jgi:uncharacterized membrane protein YqjE
MGIQVQRSIPEVLQDIVGNLQEIIRSEFRLAKAELKEEASRASKPVATFGIGLVFWLLQNRFFASVTGLLVDHTDGGLAGSSAGWRGPCGCSYCADVFQR